MDNDNQRITITDIELSSNIKNEIKKDEQYVKISTEDKPKHDIIPSKLDNQREEQQVSFFQYKKIGNCYSCFYSSKSIPLIIIGPDWIVYICLSFFMSIGTYAFMWFFNPYLDYYTKSLGVTLYWIFMFSYTYILFTNPGFPGFGSNNKAENEDVVYCQYCKIYLPKSKDYNHCNECDICIEGRDHHCQWASKCIGKWNINGFYAFCISLFFLNLYYLLSLIVIQNNYLKNNSKKHLL